MKNKIFILGIAIGSVFAQEAIEIKKEENKQEKVEENQLDHQNSIKKALSQIKLNGFGFARHFSNFGDIGGSSQQYRLKLDLTSGDVNGYSITGGILFSQGSGAPSTGSNTHSAVQGSRGVAFNENFSDRFGVGVFYASKVVKTQDLDFRVNLGRLNLNSPFNDKNLDFSTGLETSLKYNGISYWFSYADSWMTDSLAYVLRRTNLKGGGKDLGQDQKAGSIGIGNDLFILGVNGKKAFGGLDFKLYAANVYNLFDVMFFADGAYQIKTDGGTFELKAQTSVAKLNSTPNLLLGFKGKSAASDLQTKLTQQANLRGIYNLLLSYKYDAFSSKFGFLGSFGDGYGTSLTSRGAIDVGGKMWYGNFTAAYEGFGIFGSGSKNGTDIQVAYFNLGYKFKTPFKIGLDLAYVRGKNNLGVLIKKKDSHLKFLEVTPSVKYNFTKNLEISAQSAFFSGDLNLIKTRMELKYTF